MYRSGHVCTNYKITIRNCWSSFIKNTVCIILLLSNNLQVTIFIWSRIMHMVLTFTSLTVTGVQRVLKYKLRAISLCKTVEPKTETYTVFSLPTQIWCIQNSIHPNFYNYLSSQSLRFYACGWFIIDWDFCISTIGRKVFIPDKVVTFVKLITFSMINDWFNLI